MAVNKRTRFEVLRRDNHACRYCGAAAPEAVITIDHVLPVALVGTDDPSNLVAACRDCNAGKASTSPSSETVADVSADAIRWAEARRVAALAMSTAARTRSARADVAANRPSVSYGHTFRYMAGVVRNRLGELDDATRAGLEVHRGA